MEVSMYYVSIALMAVLLIWDIFCFSQSKDKFCKVMYILGAILAVAAILMKLFSY